MRYVLPLAIFVVLVAVLAIGLKLDPRYLPSPLIDHPAPEFSLSTLADESKILRKADLLGRPLLLNVWASWCRACRVEHPQLLTLAANAEAEIIGLNYKDTRPEALATLAQLGDPYRTTLFDPTGKLGLDLGVYGVPETFVLDRRGVIRYKHVGPLTPAAWRERIQPLLAKLAAEKP
ncbi:MAG: DsbE family thiol:disulfide interchange protein [Gammaproteobacteria bacterium]|nr:DsbE family thiol:disulfide interchange protein [Gammaproteobacteria bacterium]